ncbi:hypothetical protein DHD05_22295, partial [Arenibacter sp. N53]|uniref:Calx-beta domain-containing protein n=1 Tax=Arenibacter TaxID=178469 RepID=UPI0019664DDA
MKEPVMKIISLYNILSNFLVSRYLRSLAFLCAFLFVGFVGHAQDMTMDADVSMSEGNAGTTAFVFTANRTGPTTLPASATYTVTVGSADVADFDGGTLPTGPVFFAIGSPTATITINVSGDTTVEPNETFTVTLSAASAGYTIGTATATGTINNDDSEVMNMGGDVALAEGNSGTTAFVFTASRTGATTSAASATFTVTAGSANAADFGGALPSGPVNFAAGSATANFTVNVSGDTTVEPNETFTVTLSAASAGYTIGTATATGTINND